MWESDQQDCWHEAHELWPHIPPQRIEEARAIVAHRNALLSPAPQPDVRPAQAAHLLRGWLAEWRSRIEGCQHSIPYRNNEDAAALRERASTLDHVCTQLERQILPLLTAAPGQEAGCAHCWHSRGVALLTHPPQYPEVCCRCGKERVRRESLPNAEGHGPFLPRRDTQDYPQEVVEAALSPTLQSLCDKGDLLAFRIGEAQNGRVTIYGQVPREDLDAYLLVRRALRPERAANLPGLGMNVELDTDPLPPQT